MSARAPPASEYPPHHATAPCRSHHPKRQGAVFLCPNGVFHGPATIQNNHFKEENLYGIFRFCH